MKLEYTVKSNEYVNVNEVLKAEFNISARLLSKLKHEQKIFLNDKKTFISARLNPNDRILVDMNINETSENILAIEMDLKIIYEDEYFLILNKPANLPVHPSMLHYEETLSNAVKYYFDTLNLKRKIRIVNRLDKDTSGIVIFAKNEYIQECLIKQMKTKELKKEYLAIVTGYLQKKSDTLCFPISRKEGSIIERTVNPNGDIAITHYNILKEQNNLSLVHVFLETGRTHQIRVHFSHINHPILGDTLYGTPSPLINRQALHSYKITLLHPISKQILTLEAPIPNDMKFINFN